METNKINNQAGFTLIELILVVAIIGMLTAAIAPSFTTILADAGEASAKGIAGDVQSSINTIIAQNMAAGCTSSLGSGCATTGAVDISGNLDAAGTGLCSTLASGCFSRVITSGVTNSSWSKTSATVYRYTVNGGGTLDFTYTPGTNTATFKCTTAAASSGGAALSCN